MGMESRSKILRSRDINVSNRLKKEIKKIGRILAECPSDAMFIHGMGVIRTISETIMVIERDREHRRLEDKGGIQDG